METLISPPPISQASCYLQQQGNRRNVLLYHDSRLWVYESTHRYTHQRSTPTVLVAENLNHANVQAYLAKTFKNATPFPTPPTVAAKPTPDMTREEARRLRASVCPRCGGYRPCTCDSKQKCKACGYPANKSFTRCKDFDHCDNCCDCWFFECCGKAQKYNHNETPPCHYFWMLGDTMHEAAACGYCTNCCQCFKCDCGKNHMHVGKVQKCQFCASRTHMSTCCTNAHAFGSIDRKPTLTFKTYNVPTFYESKTFKLNESKRFLSPEIEVAAYRAKSWTSLIAIERLLASMAVPVVHDLSVPTGFELNIPPANGDVFVKNIQLITKKLNSLTPQITDRCGLHVHVDARDYTIDDVAKLLKLFLTIEPLVYNLVKPERRYVKYCITARAYCDFAQQGLRLEDLKRFLYGGFETEYFHIKQKMKKNTDSQAIRYRGLNLHSWFYQGTLEFRHHHGSVNANEITEWAMFCGWLVEAAKAQSWGWLNKLTLFSISTATAFKNTILSGIPDTVPNTKFILPIVKSRYDIFPQFDENAEEIRPPRARRAAARTEPLNDYEVHYDGDETTTEYDEPTEEE